MKEATDRNPVAVCVPDNEGLAYEHGELRMTDLMPITVGHANLKGLKWPTSKHFSNRLCIHNVTFPRVPLHCTGTLDSLQVAGATGPFHL